MPDALNAQEWQRFKNAVEVDRLFIDYFCKVNE